MSTFDDDFEDRFDDEPSWEEVKQADRELHAKSGPKAMILPVGDDILQTGREFRSKSFAAQYAKKHMDVVAAHILSEIQGGEIVKWAVISNHHISSQQAQCLLSILLEREYTPAERQAIISEWAPFDIRGLELQSGQ